MKSMNETLADSAGRHTPEGASASNAKKRKHPNRRYSPLPIKDGLNATRARVPEEAAGRTAWEFVETLIQSQRHLHPDDNGDALARRFDKGEVVLRSGEVLNPKSILEANQDVYFYRIPAPETPVPYDIPILHEDEHLLVADKPPFMATMPRARHIVETATVQLRRKTGISELSPAHRLDRLTSGVLVFTKTRDVRGAYQTLFSQRTIEKTYTAIAEHKDIEFPALWETRIEKTPGEIQGRIVDGPINAITHLTNVEPLAACEESALQDKHGVNYPLAQYTLKPKTGKTHQLRLHMWRAGVPILGDPVYPVIYPAEVENMAVPMHLTAKSIAFIDPLSGKPRSFHSNR